MNIERIKAELGNCKTPRQLSDFYEALTDEEYEALMEASYEVEQIHE